MTIYDDPNREAVGLPPIWTDAGEPPPEVEPGDDHAAELDGMTKEQLVAYADAEGISYEAGATKAAVRAAIDAAER